MDHKTPNKIRFKTWRKHFKKLIIADGMSTNVYCQGCDKLEPTYRFWYQVGGCTSSVHFCGKCTKIMIKEHPGSPKEEAWHENNIKHDESVF